jgi:hypothetical protein
MMRDSLRMPSLPSTKRVLLLLALRLALKNLPNIFALQKMEGHIGRR